MYFQSVATESCNSSVASPETVLINVLPQVCSPELLYTADKFVCGIPAVHEVHPT